MFSTRQAAKKLNIEPRTLSRYVQIGKLPAPKMFSSGKMTVHLWTEDEIENVRKLLPKIANGRKTRYKKQSAPTARRGRLSDSQSRQARDRSAKPKTKSKSKKKKT